MHVAHQVDEHLQLQGLLLMRQTAGLEFRDDLRHGLQHVAFRVGGHRLEGLPLVHVQVVPRLRVGVVGRMAGVVEPVGIVDGRMSVEYLVDLLCGGGRQVAFGDVGRHVVSLLSPGQGAADDEQAQPQQN